MDTIETIEWDITDAQKETVLPAVKFMKKPNSQDTFQTLIKQTIPDLLRYDQAVWVKTKALAGNLLELKAYSGPEFWIEVDNKFDEVMGQYGLSYYGPWSHGFVKRYWQHSRPGVYIPFAVTDICMLMMYKKADSIYGTDFLQQLKWQLEYMIDSTKAAGMTFANGIGPSLIWKHPDLSSIEQLTERNMEVELENKGAENFGNILHLIGQEDISTAFPELLKMQWLDGQKFISSIIWAMFGFSASEFTSDDVNRATAYINQNITKSKMLAPILRHIETVINTEVLTDLDGYQEDWIFAFKPVVELDDKLKEAQHLQAQATVVKSYVDMQVPLEEAMRIAGVEEEHITAVTQAIDTVSQQEGASMESAFQRLLQENGQPPRPDIGNGPPGQPPEQQPPGNQPPGTPVDAQQAPMQVPVLPPVQGGMPHVEGYSGQSENDSGKPEDDGQPQKKLPFFEKADFKESDHPRADDGKFGSGSGSAKKPAGDAGDSPAKPGNPQKKWSGKIYQQYAKVISLTPKTSAELKDDISKQMSEFKEITGIEIHRVDTYDVEKSLALGQTDPSRRVGFADYITKEYIAKQSIVNVESDIKDCEQWVKEAKESGDKGQERDMQEMLDHYNAKLGYTNQIYAGNGIRNPVIDHENFHYLQNHRLYKHPHDSKEWESAYTTLKENSDKCVLFCKQEKFSFYGGESTSHSIISSEEGAAEVYSYWKGGNKIPEEIEQTFIKLERGEI